MGTSGGSATGRAGTTGSVSRGAAGTSARSGAPGASLGTVATAGTVAAGEALTDAEGNVWVKPTWEQVVREHSGRVYRLAYRLTGNPHDAEDITQEVFVRVFRSLDSYRPGTFEGWLHRITTNLFLDTVRRKQRQRTDALAEDAADRLPGREPGPEREFEFRHLTDDVQAALDALSPEFRAAVVLSDIEGLTYEEIATTLGVKLGTVRSRIHRGRAQLRRALEHRRPGRGAVATPLLTGGLV